MINGQMGKGGRIMDRDAQHYTTNTKSLAKEFSEILIFEYFGLSRMGSDVFFDADSESPRMT